MYQLYEKIDEDTDNIIGEFIPKKDEKLSEKSKETNQIEYGQRLWIIIKLQLKKSY